MSEDLSQKISHLNFMSNQIIGFYLKLGIFKAILIQTYPPPQGCLQEEKDEFYRHLQEVKDSLPYTESIIITGGMNEHNGQDRSIGDRNKEENNIIDSPYKTKHPS